MNITELHNLSAVEKLKIIEALWSDLISDESSLPNLAWHETEFKETSATQARALSASISRLLTGILPLTAERIYIEFSDCPAEFWGWNGSTFG